MNVHHNVFLNNSDKENLPISLDIIYFSLINNLVLVLFNMISVYFRLIFTLFTLMYFQLEWYRTVNFFMEIFFRHPHHRTHYTTFIQTTSTCLTRQTDQWLGFHLSHLRRQSYKAFHIDRKCHRKYGVDRCVKVIREHYEHWRKIPKFDHKTWSKWNGKSELTEYHMFGE